MTDRMYRKGRFPNLPATVLPATGAFFTGPDFDTSFVAQVRPVINYTQGIAGGRLLLSWEFLDEGGWVRAHLINPTITPVAPAPPMPSGFRRDVDWILERFPAPVAPAVSLTIDYLSFTIAAQRMRFLVAEDGPTSATPGTVQIDIDLEMLRTGRS